MNIKKIEKGKVVLVSNYNERHKIKKAGGRWSPALRAWTFNTLEDLYNSDLRSEFDSKIISLITLYIEVNNVPEPQAGSIILKSVNVSFFWKSQILCFDFINKLDKRIEAGIWVKYAEYKPPVILCNNLL